MDLRANREQIIYTHNLTKSFDGTVAVKDLNLDIPSGSIFGFIGPSGCGKTTTVRLLLGVHTSDSGEIEVLNTHPQNFGRKDREQIGYMPQQFVLYPDLTVWENLNFVASIYGVPIRRHKQLQTVLDLVELTGYEKKKALNLSGGMQRRLTLASSLIHNPRLIFLDEPTAGIDPVLRRKFWDYFQTLKEKGNTLFVTTQYVGEAAYCDYVGVMANGRLLVVDTPAGLRRQVLGGEIIHLYTQQIMNENQLNQLREQPFVQDNKIDRLRGKGLEISVDKADSALPLLIQWCQDQNIIVDSASEYVPVFDDVFVKLIEQETMSASEEGN
jgi:ABC-2 type transport system ATP-binding protein